MEKLEELDNHLKNIKVGNPSPNFISFLMDAEKYSAYTSKTGNHTGEILKEVRSSITDVEIKSNASDVLKKINIVKGIAIQKTDMRLETLCDLLNAYIHLCISTDNLRKEAGNLLKKMEEITKKPSLTQLRETQRKKTNSMNQTLGISISQKVDEQRENEVDVHVKVANHFLFLLSTKK